MRAGRIRGIVVATALFVGVGWLAVSAQVVINEIAWAGTGASSSDEWIELFNPTAEPVDLTGWVVTFDDVTIPLELAEGTTVEVRRSIVEAGGYFLLERTDDAAVSDVEADLIYRGNLSNGGADVRLLDPEGRVVDDALFAESGWPAGTGPGEEPEYGSMERVRSDWSDWRTNDGVVRNGLDADGEPLNGTPGRENSATALSAVAPRIEIVSPSATSTSLSGVYAIEWSATDPDDPPTALAVSVYVSTDGGDGWQVVVENLANTGNYLWDTIAAPDGVEFRLRLVVTDPDGHVGEATSVPLRIEAGGG